MKRCQGKLSREGVMKENGLRWVYLKIEELAPNGVSEEED